MICEKPFHFSPIRPALCIPFLVILYACTGIAEDNVSWVKEIGEENGIQVVRTLKGSTWTTQSRLEEVASIGVADGPEEYMLGRVIAVYATPERTFLIDQRPLAVSVYDRLGSYLFTLGQRGSGPGEYLGPASLVVDPPEQTIYLRDAALSRISLFDYTGAYQKSWPLQIGSASFEPLVMTTAGCLYTVLRVPNSPGNPGIRYGMIAVSATGPIGEALAVPAYDFEREIIEWTTPQGLLAIAMPYSPEVVWAMSPSGAMISGVSDAYRLRVDASDGTSLIIERDIAPVTFLPDERQWYRDDLIRTVRQGVPGRSWSGPSFPNHKPFFTAFLPDDSGRIWVIREGQGYLNPYGIEEPQSEQEAVIRPRWSQMYLADLFEENGRFLGSVELPVGTIVQSRTRPFVTGDEIVLLCQGPVGELIVKRYRLVH